VRLWAVTRSQWDSGRIPQALEGHAQREPRRSVMILRVASKEREEQAQRKPKLRWDGKQLAACRSYAGRTRRKVTWDGKGLHAAYQSTAGRRRATKQRAHEGHAQRGPWYSVMILRAHEDHAQREPRCSVMILRAHEGHAQREPRCSVMILRAHEGHAQREPRCSATKQRAHEGHAQREPRCSVMILRAASKEHEEQAQRKTKVAWDGKPQAAYQSAARHAMKQRVRSGRVR